MSIEHSPPSLRGVDSVAITDLHAFLEGRWSLHRSVVDRAAHTAARIEGTARWRTCACDGPDDRSLRYEEHATMVIDAYRSAVSRAYRYEFPTGGAADVYFTDGRFFHPLDLALGSCSVEHRCGDDTYRGWFIARSERELHQRWSVTGPHKAYVSSTVYRAILP